MASGVSILGIPGLNLVDTNAFQYGPKGDMSPEAALKEQALNRKQQIANLLIQRGLAGMPQGQMAGRFYVPPSPVQGVANIAQILAGLYGTHKIDEGRADIAKMDQDMVTKALEDYKRKTGPQAVEGQAYGPGAPVESTVSYNMQNMPDPSLTPSGTWDIDKLQPDTSAQVQENKNRLAMSMMPQAQAPQAEAPLAGVPQEMNPWTMELVGNANQPPAAPPAPTAQPDALAAAYDQGQQFTRQPYSQPYSEITMNAPTTEGAKPTGIDYQAASPESKRQALIELMANQHPRVAGMAKILAQEEQQQRQLELQQQQALMMERLKEQAALNLKQTPSADTQLNIASQEKLHTTPSGNAQLGARDQVVTTGPNGEIVPNQPVIDAKTKIAEAGAARTTTNIQNYTPLNQELQKKGADKLMDNYEKLRDVPAQIENLQKARALISKSEPFVGSFGEKKLAIATFFNNNLGTNINPDQIANANELRTRVFQNVMDNLKKMDAQPSQYQQQVMMEALGTIDKDPRALDRMLNAYEDVLRSKVDIHNKTIGEMKQSDKTITFPYEMGISLPERVQPKSVLRTGKTKDGRKVVEYSDGSVEYAQ